MLHTHDSSFYQTATCHYGKEFFTCVKTFLGSFVIKEVEGAITNIFFGSEKLAHLSNCHEICSPLLKEAKKQLFAYCEGKLHTFSLPINPAGTPFQKKVWKELLSIPYGTTTSYGTIAKSIGCFGGARAVGRANNKNPIPLLIPCHRVIGANGSLVGYAGGVTLKKELLAMESALFFN